MDDREEHGSEALMLAGGDPPTRVPDLDGFSQVVAVDGGLAVALSLGVIPEVVVGDLDSADPADVSALRERGGSVEQHPVDKDATDWELGLRHVVASGHGRVTVVGGGGGRIDHLLANALVLSHDDFATLEVDWYVGNAVVRMARHGRTVAVSGAAGDHVSLLAVGGEASGVSTEGLRWRLDGATLSTGTSLGVSNEMEKSPAIVSVDAGMVLVIHEGAS